MTAAAISAVLGGRKTLKRKVESETDLRVITREGLPVQTFPFVAEGLAVDRKILAQIIGISDRTLSRRLASDARLSADESDRMMRLARVMAHAIDTFGTQEKAAHWMQTSNLVLEGQTPLSLLDTDAGVRQVDTILGRIDYGLYS